MLFKRDDSCYDKLYIAAKEGSERMKRLSIVVPCYNEEASLPLYYAACARALEALPVEPEGWLIDDGSHYRKISPMRALGENDEL